jgi:hypothetical protein
VLPCGQGLDRGAGEVLDDRRKSLRTRRDRLREAHCLLRIPRSRDRDTARLLVVVYGIFAVAAVVSIVATIVLEMGDRGRRLAVFAITFGLVGVLVVGALSLPESSWFPRATVWSGFGIGYPLIALLLPVLGLWWLRHDGASRRTEEQRRGLPSLV